MSEVVLATVIAMLTAAAAVTVIELCFVADEAKRREPWARLRRALTIGTNCDDAGFPATRPK